jgi:hypothetical protein
LVIFTIEKKPGAGGSSNIILKRTLIVKKSSAIVKEKVLSKMLAVTAGKYIKV